MCDPALPEITSAFEINHTKIAGEANCTPTNDRITQTDYNQVDYNLPQQPNQLQRHHHHHESQERFYHHQEPGRHHHPHHNHHNHQELPPTPAHISLDNKLNLPPLPYQNQLPTTLEQQDNEAKVLRSTNLQAESEMQDQQQQQQQQQEDTLRNTRNVQQQQQLLAMKQQKELNQLATQIEELKSRVDELMTKNQRIASQILPIRPNPETVNNDNIIINNKTNSSSSDDDSIDTNTRGP